MAENVLVESNDVVLIYTVTDQDNAAVDLTGASVQWSIRESLDHTPAIEKSTTSGISITNAAGGVFQVTLNAADSVDLAIANETTAYYMEAVITDSSNKIYTITTDDFEPDTLKIRPIYTEV